MAASHGQREGAWTAELFNLVSIHASRSYQIAMPCLLSMNAGSSVLLCHVRYGVSGGQELYSS